ncbi:hypothetical protein PanWU01x14_083020, partial [Parasponia andersonii]
SGRLQYSLSVSKYSKSKPTCRAPPARGNPRRKTIFLGVNMGCGHVTYGRDLVYIRIIIYSRILLCSISLSICKHN